MLLIGRIVVILFALWLAYMAAGLAFAAGMVVPDIGVMDYDPIERWIVFGVGFITTSIAVTIAILPTFLLVAIAEGLRLRSFLFYGVCGGLIGALVYFSTDTTTIMENSTDIAPIRFSLQLAAAAGILGGLVYWLIAGRNAGRWMDYRAG
jgi:hypothetical protein